LDKNIARKRRFHQLITAFCPEIGAPHAAASARA
jgi:hypothetical protein